MSIIEINGITKSYGDIKAVNGISFVVNKWEMFGLVGPDGAGKTTTIRILCGLLNSDTGTSKLFDEDITKKRKFIQNNIGYLSQKFSLYGDLSVDENIEFFADIHDVKDYRERRNELLDFTRLKPFRDRLADKLSGGMKQKLALACSLIHKPKVLFLDEPTTGVDPISRRDFWKILSSLLKEGITIFLTTPYLDEAERCNRVALMNKGKIMMLDTPQVLKESIGKRIYEVVCTDARNAFNVINSKTQFDVQLFGDRMDILIDADVDVDKIALLLKENKIDIIDTRNILPSLENVLMYLIKE